MPDLISTLNGALEGRYRIERQLGEGGMATVHLAEDLKHERHVALKVLKPELAAAVGAARFLSEIKTTANLQHPNILPLFDSGEAAGFVYYVMPYVEGESLRDRLSRDGPLEVEDAVAIALEVADALDYAHRKGVVHRDVKPANLLFSQGHAMVADFGVARAMDVAAEGGMTRTGVAVGTFQYISPEQAFGSPDIDGRADVFSLGCVVFEMLTGRPPFVGSTPRAVLAALLGFGPPSLSDERPGIPPTVAYAVERALEKEPEDRFATAREFATSLAGTSEGLPRSARRSAAKRRLERLKAPLLTYLGVGAPALLLVWALANISVIPGWWVPAAVTALVGGLFFTPLLLPRAGDRLTSSGIPSATAHRLTADHTRMAPVAVARARAGWLALGVLLATVASGLAWRALEGPPTGIPSLAVLPFDSPLSTEEQAQFASGLHVEVLGQLSKIAALRVLARGSVSDFPAGDGVGIDEIRDFLGVSHVVSGTVRLVGDQVRVSLELFDGSGTRPAWTARYTESGVELSALPTEIARHIALAVRVDLTENEIRALESGASLDADAYEAFILARDFLRSSFDAAGAAREARLESAISRFGIVSQLEPAFALPYAYAGLAHLYLYWFGFDQSDARVTLARGALDTAVEMSPDAPEANLGLGYYYYWINRDYEEAARHFTLAQERLPGDPALMTALGVLRRRQGRLQEAASQQERGFERDPRNASYAINLGFTFRGLRQFDEALRYVDRSIALAPGVGGYQYKAEILATGRGDLDGARAVLDEAETLLPSSQLVTAWFWIHLFARDYEAALRSIDTFGGTALGQPFVVGTQGASLPLDMLRGQVRSFQGQDEEARAYLEQARIELEAALVQSPSDPRTHAALGEVYAGLGRSEDAMREARTVEELVPVDADQWSGPSYIEAAARIAALAGEVDEAVRRLDVLLSMNYNTSLTEHSLRLDPRWDAVRDHPAFQALQGAD